MHSITDFDERGRTMGRRTSHEPVCNRRDRTLIQQEEMRGQ